MYIGIRNELARRAIEQQRIAAKFAARAVQLRCTRGLGDTDDASIAYNADLAATHAKFARDALFQIIGERANS